MKRLKLALVGRPNVGKSALFNRICKKRLSIVHAEEGITRDRLYAEADFFGRPFEAIDTGGIDPTVKNSFIREVKRQTEEAVEEADCLIMVVDAQAGPTALDHEVAKLLFKAKKPLVLAVNKVDNSARQDELIAPFYCLGVKKVIPVSALQGFHIAELLEAAFEKLHFDDFFSEDPPSRIAIVGRTNAGKSTLLNYLLQKNRVLVSSEAGTTRDSVDVSISVQGKNYLLIDTAGIRKKSSEHLAVEKFAALRTQKAIEKADICCFILDANQGITAQEKKIGRLIQQKGKGCLLLFNKWDLVKGYRMEHCLSSIRKEVPFFAHCPALFVSAKTGRNLDKLFSGITGIEAGLQRRLSTSSLNKFMEGCLQKCAPPMILGKRLRIYYLTQTDSAPPHFHLFVNYPKLMTPAYRKYLINRLRQTYGFGGVPLFFSIRGKKTNS